jgi:AraC-like DNA-binding protein
MTSVYEEWPLTGASRVIDCRWEQRVDGEGAGRVQRVLPDGCADVVIVDRLHAHVVGPTAEVALPHLAPGAVVVGLRVRTEAIRAVFGLPAMELRDQIVAVDEVLGSGPGRRVAEALLEPGSAGDRWLVRWLSGAGESVDGRAAAAVGQLRERPGSDVASVAEQVGLSCRQLRRVVENETGLGPKTLQRIGRLQRFLRLAESGDGGLAGGGLAESGDGGLVGGGGLSRWAAIAGYADQAHLSRDVHDLAATTPARLLAERRA